MLIFIRALAVILKIFKNSEDDEIIVKETPVLVPVKMGRRDPLKRTKIVSKIQWERLISMILVVISLSTIFFHPLGVVDLCCLLIGYMCANFALGKNGYGVQLIWTAFIFLVIGCCCRILYVFLAFKTLTKKTPKACSAMCFEIVLIACLIFSLTYQAFTIHICKLAIKEQKIIRLENENCPKSVSGLPKPNYPVIESPNMIV